MVAEKTSTSSTAPDPYQSIQNDDMRIAWRYNNLDKVDSEQGSSTQSDGKNAYTFDLSQSVEDGALNSMDITVFGKDDVSYENKIFHNPAYASLIQKLEKKLTEPEYDATGQSSTTKKNLLRICIESFGSPLWYDEHFTKDICLFLTILKAAVRSSLSVCCITIPSHLFKHIVSKFKNVSFKYIN